MDQTGFTSFTKMYEEKDLDNEEPSSQEQDMVREALLNMRHNHIDEYVKEGIRLDKVMGHPFTHWTTHMHYLTPLLASKKPGPHNLESLETALDPSRLNILRVSLLKNQDLLCWLWRSLPDSGLWLCPGYSFAEVTAYMSHTSEKLHSSVPLSDIISRDAFSCSSRDLPGLLFTWGSNSKGQLGSIVTVDEQQTVGSHRQHIILHPRLSIHLRNTPMLQVCCGFDHCLGLSAFGTVFAWGNNRSGQLGIGLPEFVSAWVPVPVPSLTNIVKVAAGSEHSVALSSSGELFTWGQGEGGLLGLGHTESAFSPQRLAAIDETDPVTDVVCGGLHTLALTSSRRVFSWGRGEGGQLGTSLEGMVRGGEHDIFQLLPTPVLDLDGLDVVQIAAGDAHSVALDASGNVWTWGFSSSGQLGHGIVALDYSMSDSRLRVLRPQRVPLEGSVRVVGRADPSGVLWTDFRVLRGRERQDFRLRGERLQPARSRQPVQRL